MGSTREYNLKAKFGLTLEQFQEMLDAQDGRCAICGNVYPGWRDVFSVDHDRSCCPGQKTCGECVRGLLCMYCNLGLGHMKDDPAILRSAVRYLAKHN